MSTRQSNVTAAFIDLATFELLESSLYGGSDAITYFVREVQKCTWFSQIPVKLSSNSTPGFGSDFDFSVSRAADYLLSAWLRVELPGFNMGDHAQAQYPGGVSWTPNLGHNFIEEVKILFNDLEVQSIDSYTLDWWAALMYPGDKMDGYNKMIGNVDEMVAPSTSKSNYTINVPLPLFFTKDTGIALPTAALPYNDIKIHVKTRGLDKLLVGWDEDGLKGGVDSGMAVTTHSEMGMRYTNLTTSTCELWTNYVVVSNDERSKMGAGPRDIVVEQTQKVDVANQEISSAAEIEKIFSFNHTVKMLAWSLQNYSHMNQYNYHSNYTDSEPDPDTGFVEDGKDLLKQVTLKYDNSERFTLNSDYFQHVQPFYFANKIPSGEVGASPVGYNMYSYSLNPTSSDPCGSTNYGKLTNVALKLQTNNPEKAHNVRLLIRALNFNIVRISGGALGFPVL